MISIKVISGLTYTHLRHVFRNQIEFSIKVKLSTWLHLTYNSVSIREKSKKYGNGKPGNGRSTTSPQFQNIQVTNSVTKWSIDIFIHSFIWWHLNSPMFLIISVIRPKSRVSSGIKLWQLSLMEYRENRGKYFLTKFSAVLFLNY